MGYFPSCVNHQAQPSLETSPCVSSLCSPRMAVRIPNFTTTVVQDSRLTQGRSIQVPSLKIWHWLGTKRGPWTPRSSGADGDVMPCQAVWSSQRSWSSNGKERRWTQREGKRQNADNTLVSVSSSPLPLGSMKLTPLYPLDQVLFFLG